MEEPEPTQLQIDPREIEWTTCRGSGAGGQHRNKTDSAVQMVHLPTGIRVRVETERSQHQNRELALSILRARVYEAQHGAKLRAREEERRRQVGSGMRGDKVRTIRSQDDVTDHQTGRRIRYKDYIKGNWDGLY